MSKRQSTKNKIIIPSEHQFLLDYLEAIRKEHTHVSFMTTGVDDRTRVLSTPTSDRIYVVPNFSVDYTDPQIMPKDWGPQLSLDEVLTNKKWKRLFIKGDPGIGKTTLLSRIAYIFASLDKKGYQERLNYPIPMIATLREGAFRRVRSWNGFIDAIFKQPAFKGVITPDLNMIKQLFKNGQVFLMLDGLDEVTDVKQRKRLATIIQDGIKKYPNNHWWCSTRIVGFQQEAFWLGMSEEEYKKTNLNVRNFDPVAFEEPFARKGRHFVTTRHIRPKRRVEDGIPEMEDHDIWKFDSDVPLQDIDWEPMQKLEIPNKFKEIYLAPFDDHQVRQFMKLWFDLYTPNPNTRKKDLDKFLESLSGHDSIRHLSRIPNMLTMMALYHKVNHDFPDGRYELYDNIIATNLKTLLKQRNLKVHELKYDELRKCLAELAFAMQKNRTGDLNKDAFLTISRKDAIQIFEEVLQDIARSETSKERNSRIEGFFDSLSIRSDVLMERGEKEYGFLHLSIQEFLAAERLQQRFIEVTGRKYRNNKQVEEDYWEEMKTYSKESSWEEAIVLYFEGFKAVALCTVDDCLYAFETLFDWDKKTGQVKNENLALAILMDEYIAQMFTENERWTLLSLYGINHFLSQVDMPLIEWALRKEYYVMSNTAQNISNSTRWFKGGELLNHTNKLRIYSLNDKEVKDIDLSGLNNLQYLNLCDTQVSDLSSLSGLSNLQFLNLSNTPVSELGSLSSLSNLEFLNLNNTTISEFGSLSSLSNLNVLYLNNTLFSEFGSLSSLNNLYILVLSNTQIRELSSLSGMSNLLLLDLNNTQIKDLSSLSSLSNLQNLYLNNTQVRELSSLSGLSNLQSLYLNNTQVKELSSLSGLSNLQTLSLNNTQVRELSSLSGLSNLQTLSLNNTQVRKLSSLSGLSNLQTLSLNNTQVRELSSLSGLNDLQRLSLNNTQVRKLNSLSDLSNLQTLDLSNTQIRELEALSSLTKLQNLNLSNSQVNDLNSLHHLNNLRILELSDTQVKKLKKEIKALKKEYPNLDILVS